MSETNIDPYELNSLLLNHPPEIFCKIWRETEIYDYEEIKKFAINNKNLIPVLDMSLRRVDIDCLKLGFNYESLLDRLQSFKLNSPQLKEINISNLNVKDIDTLLSIPNIKSTSNIHLDNVDHKTTHSIFERIIELYKRYDEDFIFDVSFRSKSTVCVYVVDIVYHIKYDRGTLFYDGESVDQIYCVGEKCTNILSTPPYLNQIVQELRPHTIETYGGRTSMALMRCDSIKTLKFRNLGERSNSRHVRFELFINANNEYMNIKYPDKKDVINLEHEVNMNTTSTLELKNCSVTTIIYPDIDPNEIIFSRIGRCGCIYSTITTLILPISIFTFEDIFAAYPNVKVFYYHPFPPRMSKGKDVLSSLEKKYPNIEFKQFSQNC
jgi:hypothetical protein